MPETPQSEQESTDAGQKGESPVITTLRQQNRSYEQSLKEAQEKIAEFERQATEASRATVQQLVDTAGFPGLTEVVLERLEGQANAESVAKVLDSLGLAAPAGEGSGGEQDGGAPPVQTAEELAKVASIGSRAAAASGGNHQLDPLAEINSVGDAESSYTDVMAGMQALANQKGFGV